VDKRRRLLWLPLSSRLLLRYGPRLRRVNDRAGCSCCLQHLQCLFNHPSLLRHVAGLAQRMTERELDGQRARHSYLLHPEGHIRHHYRRKPCGLERACQHGHIPGTVRSDRSEQDAVHTLGSELLRYLRAVDLLPRGRIRGKALVAHKGVGVGRQPSYAPLSDQLSKTVNR
jgi:hypothetical protein